MKKHTEEQVELFAPDDAPTVTLPTEKPRSAADLKRHLGRILGYYTKNIRVATSAEKVGVITAMERRLKPSEDHRAARQQVSDGKDSADRFTVEELGKAVQNYERFVKTSRVMSPWTVRRFFNSPFEIARNLHPPVKRDRERPVSADIQHLHELERRVTSKVDAEGIPITPLPPPRRPDEPVPMSEMKIDWTEREPEEIEF